MKKQWMGIMMAAALTAAQAVSVWAAPSPTAQVTVPQEDSGKYTVMQYVEEKLEELRAAAPEVASVIEQINAGEKAFEAVKEAVTEEVVKEIEEKTGAALAEVAMLTRFVDLDTIGEVEKSEDGKYEVTLQVPTLTEAMVNVQVLHYSTQRSLWEVITPEAVDYGAKTVTAKFEDLSPVAVIAKEDPSKAAGDINAEGSGTSPKTGNASHAAAWGCAAALLAAGAAASFYKGRKRA